MAEGKPQSIYCVKISDHCVIDILVRPGEQTRLFKEAYPDALPHSSVWVSEDPVVEVERQRALMRKKS